MMIGGAETVNRRNFRRHFDEVTAKKSRAQRARLRYWPREADTITFQEGLLSFRATGGGGQRRNANAQRENIMVCIGAARQPPAPHVSHAGIAGW
jgi:hypothetical protein